MVMGQWRLKISFDHLLRSSGESETMEIQFKRKIYAIRDTDCFFSKSLLRDEKIIERKTPVISSIIRAIEHLLITIPSSIALAFTNSQKISIRIIGYDRQSRSRSKKTPT
jgi:hypothetical protein